MIGPVAMLFVLLCAAFIWITPWIVLYESIRLRDSENGMGVFVFGALCIAETIVMADLIIDWARG